jgi:hypothetical protein
MLNKEQNLDPPKADATGDDSSNAVKYIKTIRTSAHQLICKLTTAIVRTLFRYLNIMCMALSHTCVGDFYKCGRFEFG